MSETRTFHNFQLGVDSVYDLSEQLIPRIADHVDLDIGDDPSEQALVALMRELGPNKETRTNPEHPEIDRSLAADLVDESGVQLALDRSLWQPEYAHDDFVVPNVVMTGGVANWMDRTAALVEGLEPKKVILAAGDRLMKSGTEVNNPNIRSFFENMGRYPTEQEYMGSRVLPRLISAGHEVVLENFNTQNGDEIAQGIIERNPNLLEETVLVARVANASIQLAVQLRQAARAKAMYFDTNPDDPQLFAISDSRPVARTDEQDADPQNFQKASTALRQVAVTALSLHKAHPVV